MPLITRTDGSLAANIIHASWFNDFNNLLTGSMQDQEVSIKNNVALNAIQAGPTVAPGGSLAAGTTMGIGLYKYSYTWVSADGESAASPIFSITTTSGNQKVNLTGIAVGPTGTLTRNIYRSQSGASLAPMFLASIADNTTTTFADTLADTALAQNFAPVYSTFGGSILAKNAAGTKLWQTTNEQGLYVAPYTPSFNPSLGGTITIYQVKFGPIIYTFIEFTNAHLGASSVQLKLPFPYTTEALIRSGAAQDATTGVPINLVTGGSNGAVSGTVVSVGVYVTLAAGGGTVTVQSNINKYSFAEAGAGFDTIRFIGGGTSTALGGLSIEGF